MSAAHKNKVVDLRGKRPVRREHIVKRASSRSRGVSPVRRNRIRTRSLIGALSLIGICGGFFMVSYLSYAPQFSVNAFSIVGAAAVSKEVITLRAEQSLYDSGHAFIAPTNVIVISEEKIENDIRASLPRVKNVEVKRSSILAREIVIEIQEREPYAVWCSDDATCFLVDSDGYIYAPRKGEYLLNEYIFRGGISTSSSPVGSTLIPGEFTRVKDILYELFKEGYEPVSVTFEDGGDVRIQCTDFALKVVRTAEPVALVRNLELALSSDALARDAAPIEYIDLRFGNRVYFKLKAVDSVQ